MAEKRSTEIWKRATPLNEAWKTYAPPELIEAHSAAFTPQSVAPPSPEGGWIAKALDVFAAAGMAIKAHNDAEDALKTNLCQRIADGEFEALGYRIEPTRSRGPVVLRDPDFKKYRPNWAEETVELRGEFFSDIRIAPASLRPPPKKRGRPGSPEVILQAIADLASAPNSDFCDELRAQACQRVRELLAQRGFDISKNNVGLSDKNIEKLILRHCPKRQLQISE